MYTKLGKSEIVNSEDDQITDKGFDNDITMAEGDKFY